MDNSRLYPNDKGIRDKDRGGALRLHRYCQEQERGLMVELKC